MLVRKFDSKYRFLETFNIDNGMYLRTDILDEEGKMTGEDPFMGSTPSLLDIGIMGTPCVCADTCPAQCYQSRGHKSGKDMTLTGYTRIIDQVKGQVFQIALGGSGDPDTHPDIKNILAYTRENNIVPNFTTSGRTFTKEKAEMCKEYCGAVAVSWHKEQYTIDAVKMLLDAGVKTNIHYVLGKHTIDEAIWQLKYAANGQKSFMPYDVWYDSVFPGGINAVVFLAHKPVGLGERDKVLSVDDPKMIEFFRIIDEEQLPFKVGLDACNVPAVINLSKNINHMSIETCDGARFSAYIGPDSLMTPCSFDQTGKYGLSLVDHTVEYVWNSEGFEAFRKGLASACTGCASRNDCMGGCPIEPIIVACKREERTT